MGQEAVCTVRYTGQVSTGKAYLESQDLVFRGDFRLRIPVLGVQSVAVHDGVLTVVWSSGLAEFDLGPLAVKWEEKIRNPKSLVEKLGVKAGHRVAVFGIQDPQFLQDLRKFTEDIVQGRPARDANLVFLLCDRLSQLLPRIKSARKQIRADGAVWVIYPKGHRTITQAAVFSAGKKSGLVDVKVAAFSETHTALKFVIPRKKR